MLRHALKRQVGLIALLAGLLFMAGCLEGNSIRTGRYLPPRPAGARVDVYLDSEPNRPYEEIGLVSGEGNDAFATLSDVLYILESETRQLGADAVIVTAHWTEVDEYMDVYGHIQVHERVYADGIAIHYLRR